MTGAGGVEWWICPQCDRQFGRRGQGHVCVPAMSADEYYADLPAFHREVQEAVVAQLQTIDDVHVELVSVGVLIKHGSTIVELRPMRDWLALTIVLPRRVQHSRITRTIPMPNGGAVHGIRIRSAADIDDTIRTWLDEAMLSS